MRRPTQYEQFRNIIDAANKKHSERGLPFLLSVCRRAYNLGKNVGMQAGYTRARIMYEPRIRAAREATELFKGIALSNLIGRMFPPGKNSPATQKQGTNETKERQP
jgi:hypothetical protein